MTEYSFRQEIIWPELPEPSAADLATMTKFLEDEIRSAFFKPLFDQLQPARSVGCGCSGMLHRAGCPAAGWVS